MLLLWLIACAAPPTTSGWTPLPEPDGWPDEAGDPIPVPAALAAHDWLADVSHYGSRGIAGSRTDAGVWGVGNGRVFGLIGLDAPANTLTNHIGPDYQRDGGFFGDSALQLTAAGAALPIDDEAVQRPRGTPVVRTWTHAGALALTTTDVAPPGHDGIVRHVAVRAEAATADAGVRLTLIRGRDDPPSTADDALDQVRGPHHLRVTCDGAVRDGETLLVGLGDLAAGEERAFVCHYGYGADGPPADGVVDVPAMLEATRDDATERRSRALVLDVPDPKVADLIDAALTVATTQTDASGLVSPMHRYTSAWLRDSEGPVRLWLALGLHEEVRDLLAATHAAATTRQTIGNSWSLRTATDTPPPDDPVAFWDAAAFMPGRNAAEAPSYTAWAAAAYVDASGDTAFIDPDREAWLRASLRRQGFGDEGLLPFSGDETWRYNLQLVVGGALPEDQGWSANSSLWWVGAADALARVLDDPDLATDADATRADAEVAFRNEGFVAPIASHSSLEPSAVPFEDVSTIEAWTRTIDRGSPEAAAVAEVLAALLQQDDGLLRSARTATGGAAPPFTGHTPAFGLSALSAGHHDGASAAFDGVDHAASPSGSFGEGHLPDGRALSALHVADGLGDDAPARYRPWETGNVAAAVLDHLLGVTPRAPDGLTVEPDLPEGWPYAGATGLRLGDDRYAVRLEGWVEGRGLTLTRDGGTAPWRVTLVLRGERAFTEAWLNGVPFEATGRRVRVEVEVPPGGAVSLIGAY